MILNKYNKCITFRKSPLVSGISLAIQGHLQSQMIISMLLKQKHDFKQIQMLTTCFDRIIYF